MNGLLQCLHCSHWDRKRWQTWCEVSKFCDSLGSRSILLTARIGSLVFFRKKCVDRVLSEKHWVMRERFGLPRVQSADCEGHEAVLERRGRLSVHNLLAARVIVQVSIFGWQPSRITDIQVLLLLGFCGSTWAAAAASASWTFFFSLLLLICVACGC